MKTIEVSDEMYAKLIELATEMTEQDPRCTRMPHLFQIQTDKKVYDYNLNGDFKILIDQGGGYELESFDDIHNYLENNGIDLAEDLSDNWDDELDYNGNLKKIWKEDFSVFLSILEEKEINLVECSYSLEQEYQNAFFTAKACKEHIRLNGYHYHNPKDYLNHAWRNPEMELVSEFLCGLVNKKIHQ